MRRRTPGLVARGGVLVLCSALLGQTAGTSARGQETPVLPETRVEAAAPETGGQGEPAPYNLPSNLFESYDPLADGYRFGSPIVDGYRADVTTSGSIIAVPDADLPATVNAIPRDLLTDQQVLSIKDLVRNAPGVTIVGDSLFADRIYLRGLEVGSRDFRKDGFLDPTFVPRDFQNIERVEILKGPASMLYGPGLPSGMVNLITKKPLHDTFSNVGFQFGSFNQQRYTLDTNGYAAGDVMYRLNIAQEETESFRDFGYISRALIAPAVTWEIDCATRITWLGEWHRDHRRGDQGIPAINGDPLALPIERVHRRAGQRLPAHGGIPADADPDPRSERLLDGAAWRLVVVLRVSRLGHGRLRQSDSGCLPRRAASVLLPQPDRHRQRG